MKPRFGFKSMIVAILLVFLFTACGSDSSTTSSNSAQEARIDERNADTLITGACLARLIYGMEDLILLIMEDLIPVENETTFQGNCGAGTVTLTDNFNEQTGEFTGKLVFTEDFCHEGISIDGKITFSGIGALPYNNTKLFLEFNTLMITFEDSGDFFLLDGEIQSDTVLDPEFLTTITMDLIYEDGKSGKDYSFNNYCVTISNEGNLVKYEATGKYTDSDYGFVNIVDTIFYEDRKILLPGSFIIEGKSNTRARLQIEMPIPETYQVEVDTNGDGNYETILPEKEWKDIGE